MSFRRVTDEGTYVSLGPGDHGGWDLGDPPGRGSPSLALEQAEATAAKHGGRVLITQVQLRSCPEAEKSSQPGGWMAGGSAGYP